MRKSILILLMLGTLTAQLCFCNEDNTNQGFIEQQLIELFFENDAAITGCADNRCYLNADKISVITYCEEVGESSFATTG